MLANIRHCVLPWEEEDEVAEEDKEKQSNNPSLLSEAQLELTNKQE